MATNKITSASPEANIDPQMQYEAAIKELESLVMAMESGKLSLEATLVSYQRGAALLKHCQSFLARVEQQIQVIES